MIVCVMCDSLICLHGHSPRTWVVAMKPKEGSCFHSLLPRTLARMSQSNKDASEEVSHMYNGMRSVDLFDDHDGCSNDPEHEGRDRSQALGTLLAETFQDVQEQSFAQVNQKRRRLAFQAFSDPLLVQKTLGLESLAKPNTLHMALLFQRTQLIAKLEWLPDWQVDERLKCENEFHASLRVF